MQYKEKLDLAKKLLQESYSIKNADEGEKVFWEGHKLMEELMVSKDEDVLCGLFDFFIEDNENGVCETLANGIFDNYTDDQIINALYKKFDTFLVINMNRAAQFVKWLISNGKFDDVRKMFNTVKIKEPVKFLERLKYKCKYDKYIAILKEDIEKW
jgi:hypothetical protein